MLISCKGDVWVGLVSKVYVHLVTVGAGIISNYLREKRGDPICNVLSNDSLLLKHATDSSKVFMKVYEYLKSDPRKASPEINAMWKYIDRGLVSQVYLYHTDTGAGKFCAEILKKFLREELHIETYVIKVNGFGLDFEEGLANLLDKIVSKLHKLSKTPIAETYLNATGGFKPENSILVIAASLLNIKTIYYMHEKFKEPIELPILPLTISRKHLEKIKWIRKQEKQHGFALKKEFTEKYSEKELEELKNKKLIIEENGKIKLRKWTKTIIKIMKTT